MRKIIVHEFITLDGVIQGPGGASEDTANDFEYGGWVGPYFDEASGKIMEKQMSGEYDLLLGRKTYDIFSNYWPEHSDEWPQVNKIKKYVVSKTLKDPKWENTEILKDTEELKKLKNSEGIDLQVYGSSDLSQTLFKHDLVDELWLKIFPITLGNGKKLFKQGAIPAAWELIESKTTPSGIVVASYKRAGEVKTQDVGGDN